MPRAVRVADLRFSPIWLLAAPALAAPPPTPALAIGWQKVTVFRWSTDRCVESDTPDAPPRAFRDARGRVHLFATHQDNRALTGPDFEHLKHPCTVVYRGRHSGAPQDFSDRQWLAAFATDDGRRIHALVHDEFQGNLRRRLCPSGVYFACWENAITLAVSNDGGESFQAPPPPHQLIASLPYPYQGDIGRPIGYFQPSNIVREGGHYAVMFHAEAFMAQQGGTCLARTDDLDDAGSWRAWDGSGYGHRFENPYTSSAPAAAHVCAPVGTGSLFDVGSVTYEPGTQRFIAVTSVPHGSGNAATPPGVYVAASTDLIRWSAPALLIRESEFAAHDAGADDQYGYYSLIDEASTARDFSTISAHPSLYLYYVELDQALPPYKRNLVKLPVSLVR